MGSSSGAAWHVHGTLSRAQEQAVSTNTGVPMQAHKVYWRIQPKKTRGVAIDLNEHVVEIRKLLRTDISIDSIGAHFGCCGNTIRNFIKRRRLCDLRLRRTCITSSKREEIA
jgi:hypothetical protein